MVPQYSSRANHHNTTRLKFALLVCVVIAGVLSMNYVNLLSRRNAIEKEISNLQEIIVNLEQQNSQTSELIRYLSSTAYLEERARQEFGLKKAGEKTVVVEIPLVSTSTKEDLGAWDHNNSTFITWFTYFYGKQR